MAVSSDKLHEPAYCLCAFVAVSHIASQFKDYPRAAYTLRGSHQSCQELPEWCQRATGSTTIKSTTIHVELALRGPHKSNQRLPTWCFRYGVYTSPSTDYARKQTDTSAHFRDTRIVPILFKVNIAIY